MEIACVQFLTGVTFMVIIGLQASAAQVSISVDYTPPPGVVLGPNEYRAASGPLTLTCQGPTGTVAYNWQSSFGSPNNQVIHRLIVRSSDSRNHTCTAMDGRGNPLGSAEVEVNVVGIGIFVTRGDIGDDNNAVPNNSLVISGTRGTRFRFRCHSESMQNNSGDFIGLDGSSINNITGDPFDVTRANPAGINVRNDEGMENALTASEQGVYTCRLPNQDGQEMVEVNIGIYPNGFSTPLSITSLTFDRGASTLTCTSTGSPATTVTWRRNGAELNIDGSTYQMTRRVTDRSQSTYENVLSFTNITFTGIQCYTCSVSNNIGSASQSVTLSDLNVIELSAAITTTGTLTVGGSYTLTCMVASLPMDATISYQWRDTNDNLISVQTPNVLHFPSLELSDAGQYTCQATIIPSCVSTATEDVVLQIHSPTVEVTPDRNTLHVGSRQTLTCTITLDSALQSVLSGVTVSSQWSGPGVSSGRATVTSTTGSGLMYSSTLTLNTLQLGDAGSYTCTVTVRHSSQFLTQATNSDGASITVTVPSPTVEVTPDRIIRRVGSRPTLTCTITLDSALQPVLSGVTVSSQWRGPGVSSGRATVTSATGSGLMYSSTLTLNTLQLSDAGSYTCTVTVRHSSQFLTRATNSAGASISVRVPSPTVEVTPDRNTLRVGSRQTLTCTITLDSALQPVLSGVTVSSQWSGPGVSSGRATVTSATGRGLMYSSTLTLNTLQLGDAGSYTCTVTVRHSSQFLTQATNSDGASITIVDISIAATPPGTGANSNDYRAASTLTLTCQVQGATGTVTYSWQSTMPAMGNDKRHQDILRPTDHGTHTCTVTDQSGFTGSAIIEVNVIGIGLFVFAGDVDGDGSSDREAVPNNSLVISGNAGTRFRFRCHSESTQNNVGDFIGLDGSSINNIASDPFNVRYANPAGVDVRNNVGRENALTASEQGVYTCRLPDRNGQEMLEVNIGIYPSGFSANPRITSLTYDPSTRTLTCTSTGSPATTVTWRRNGVELNTDGSTYQMTQRVTDRRQSTYQNVLSFGISRTHSDIVGRYMCSVTNTLGMTTSQALHVSQSLGVSIAAPPPGTGANNEYRAASTLTLTCRVEGATGTVTYNWESTMPAMGNDKRHRDILRSTDDGSHTCTATDQSGFTGSATIEVNVIGIGLFVFAGDVDGDGSSDHEAVPNNSLVISGNTGTRFRLQCHSESTEDDVGDFIGLDGSSINNIASDPFDVRYANPAGINVRNREGMENALTASEQGVYTCRLRDRNGLEVNIGIYPNGFDTPPNITSLTFDSSTRTLTCTSTGSPATTVTWRRNGVELTIDGSTYQMTQRVTDRRQSTYEHVLTINVDLSTVSTYTCSVTNELGSSSQNISVANASIAITTSGPRAVIGQSYSLTCSVSSAVNLTVDYEWRDATNNVVSSGQTLLFSVLQLSDAGQYTCQATITSPFSHTLTETEGVVIQIPRPTVMVTRDNRNTLHAGSRLTLTCDIVLNQVLASMVDDITVSSEWSGPGISSGRDTVTSANGSNLGYTSTLTFNTLHTSDSGTYTCQATISPNFNPQFIMDGKSSTDVIILVQNPTLMVSLQPNATRLPNEAPYNSFTLTCTATAPEGVVAEKTFTWNQRFGVQSNSFTTLSDNGDTIQIETRSETQPVSTSELTVRRETTPGQYTYRCLVDFSDRGTGVSNTPDVDITVTGPSNPQESENVMTTDLMPNMVTVQWTVPMIAFTPETYVVYYGTDMDSLNQRSEAAVGGVNFTAQDVQISVELTALIPGTMYYYLVNSTNSHGSTLSRLGTFSTVEISPGPVSNLTVERRNRSSLRISWNKPEDPNGIIIGYTVLVENIADGQIINRAEENITLTSIIEGLNPGVPYNVSVRATNSIGGGEAVYEIQFTEEEVPTTSPNITDIVRNANHIELSWEPLSLVEARGFITNYTVSHEAASSSKRQAQGSLMVIPANQTNVVISDIRPNQAYLIRLGANTVAGSGPLTEYNSQAISTPTGQDNTASVAGGMVGGLLGVILLAGVCVGIVVAIWWLRRKEKLWFSHSKADLGEVGKSPGRDIELKTATALDDDYFEDSSFLVHRRLAPIPIAEFRNHVVCMHKDGDKGFDSEYKSIEKQPLASQAVAQIPHNKDRNRFGNIAPYDFNRVKLQEIEEVEGSDYINASFIDGFAKQDAYIAAQGPKETTVTDFWRMIWEYRLPTVVMLTRCFEAGKDKCKQYWPEEIDANITPGCNLSITLTSVLPFAEYEVRKLVVTDTSSSDPPLEVTHLYYHGWPDYGVPTNSTSLINFIKRVRGLHHPTDNKSLLVHCSAGVGRSGTFIVLDSMVQRIKAEVTVNVYEFVKNLRRQRVLMVQTEVQYVFIHDALDEMITYGETEISAINLRIAINQLTKQVKGRQISGFQNQFENLNEVSQGKVEEADGSQAQESYNRSKTRYTDKLANNTFRVRLRGTAVPGSDYINASFIAGYKQRAAYMATQGPLRNTVNDFWRMMWDYQSKCIVMLCNLQEGGVEACYPYWPKKQGTSEVYGKVKVTILSEEPQGDYIIRKLELSDLETRASAQAFTVTQFQYTEWAEHGDPSSTSSLLGLISNVVKVQMSSGNKPITVMCNDGVGRSGTFMAIHSQIERLNTEGVVDFFQYIKSARIQREGMVQSVDQYMLCHDTLADYIDSFAEYANFKEIV